jgi:DNA-binding winged helix-turn-helix (wHTH) protein
MSASPKHAIPSRRVRFADFEVDLYTGELYKNGDRVSLQKQPFDVLSLLLKRAGDLVTRGELQQALFADAINVDFEHSVNRSMNKLRIALGDSADNPKLIETLPGRGYRFIGPVIVEGYSKPDSQWAGPFQGSVRIPIPYRGALPVDSPFYIERDVDAKVHLAVQVHDSVVLLKGARQTGKTSLLARVLARVRSHHEHAVITDMQKLAVEARVEIDSFLRALAREFGESLELDVDIEAGWEPRRSASSNFERFVRRVLSVQDRHIVWCIDEADRLFRRPYATEFFSLLRAWHNERALEPDSPWLRLTIVIAYATEAHLFIIDANQSPFNVGTKFELLDFTHEQIMDLNSRYGFPTDEAGASELEALLGGHPHLIQFAFYELLARPCSPTELSRIAADEDGPFAEHLRHLLRTLERCPELLHSLRNILDSSVPMSTDHFYRLRAFGILAGDRARSAVPRCKLYRDFLCRHLM